MMWRAAWLCLNGAARDHHGDRRDGGNRGELAMNQSGDGRQDGQGNGRREETLIRLHLRCGDPLINYDNAEGAQNVDLGTPLSYRRRGRLAGGGRG